MWRSWDVKVATFKLRPQIEFSWHLHIWERKQRGRTYSVSCERSRNPWFGVGKVCIAGDFYHLRYWLTELLSRQWSIGSFRQGNLLYWYGKMRNNIFEDQFGSISSFLLFFLLDEFDKMSDAVSNCTLLNLETLFAVLTSMPPYRQGQFCTRLWNSKPLA